MENGKASIEETVAASRATREEAEALLSSDREFSLVTEEGKSLASKRKLQAGALIPTAADSRGQPKEIGHLKSVVLGLSEKLQLTLLQQEEIKLLQQQLNDSSQAKGELQTSIEETVDQLRKEGLEIENTLGKLDNEQNEAKARTAKLYARQELKKGQASALAAENEQLQISVKQHASSSKPHAAGAQLIETTSSSLSQTEQARLDLQDQLKRDSSNFHGSAETQSALLRQLIEEKRQQEAALAKQQQQFEAFKQQTNSELAKLQQQLTEQLSEMKIQIHTDNVSTSTQQHEENVKLKNNLMTKLRQTRIQTEEELVQLREKLAITIKSKREEFENLRVTKEGELDSVKGNLATSLQLKQKAFVDMEKSGSAASIELESGLTTSIHQESGVKVSELQNLRTTKNVEIDKLKHDNLTLSKDIAVVQGKLILEEEQLELLSALSERKDAHEAGARSLTGLHSSTTAEFKSYTDEHSAELASTTKAKDSLSARQNKTQIRFAERSQEIASTREAHEEIKSNIETLSGLCQNIEELDDNVQLSDTEYRSHLIEGDDHVHCLSTSSEYIMTQSKKVLKSTTNLERMKAALSDKHFEVEALREISQELKRRRPQYVPCKEDIVDLALADHVNNRQEILTVPFNREDFEIYTFGTKKVFIKLEKGKIIIRVGGGFMQIEEFIDIYTPIELEKQEARLIETNPAYRKVIGKILGAQVGYREPMSPQKAAKIIHSSVDQKYTQAFVVKKQSPVRRRGSPNKRTSN